MMTREEWYQGENAAAMLGCLKNLDDHGGTPLLTGRKRRLFACACARMVWPLLADERSRAAVAVAEAFADDGGEATRREEVFPAWHAAWAVRAEPRPEKMAACAAAHCCNPDSVPGYAAHDAALAGVPLPHITALLRDAFGDPWGPLPAVYEFADVTSLGGERRRMSTYTSAPWLTPQVLALAKVAYAERRPDGSLDAGRLAVLSDATEEEGCGVEVALRHLRGEVYCSRCLGAGAEWERIVDGLMANINGGPPLRASRVTIAEQCRACGGKGYVAKTTPCYRGCHVLDWLLGKG